MKPVKSKPSAGRIATEEKLRRCQERYDQLKEEVRQLGYICQGTITKRTLPCGKPSCACHQDPRKRHGPYVYWTRKVRGRTETRMVPPSLVTLYREGIRNHRRLEVLIRRMQKVSLQAFEAARIPSKA